jgi:MYXO-CTERM domain-containing protein
VSPYDDRRATLDPGLTALTLRARRAGVGRYPFLDEATRTPGRWLAAVLGALGAWRRRRRGGAGAGPTAPRPPAR